MCCFLHKNEEWVYGHTCFLYVWNYGSHKGVQSPEIDLAISLKMKLTWEKILK